MELRRISQPLIRSADVTADALECGTRFCVAEFRANDPAVLGRFTKNLLTAREFEAGATVGFGAEATPAGMTQRLLFSHDPSINSITVSPGTLPATIEPADAPPVIQ